MVSLRKRNEAGSATLKLHGKTGRKKKRLKKKEDRVWKV